MENADSLYFTQAKWYFKGRLRDGTRYSTKDKPCSVGYGRYLCYPLKNDGSYQFLDCYVETFYG
jgi:hypothetical protein